MQIYKYIDAFWLAFGLILHQGCSFKCIDLAMCVSGRFVRDWYLVLECKIDYFYPLQLFTLIFLAC